MLALHSHRTRAKKEEKREDSKTKRNKTKQSGSSHSHTHTRTQAEIDAVLASCGSDEAPLEEGAEVTQMQVIERVLRHGLCSYQKNEGTCSVADMEKWLVYTAQDQMELNKLKRDTELQAKYANFGTDSAATVPQFNWAAEYSAAVDREVVAEKRLRCVFSQKQQIKISLRTNHKKNTHTPHTPGTRGLPPPRSHATRPPSRRSFRSTSSRCRRRPSTGWWSS